MTKEIVTCPSCGKKNRIRDRANNGRPKCANCKSYLTAAPRDAGNKPKWMIGLAVLALLGIGIGVFSNFQSEEAARETLQKKYLTVEYEFRDFFALRVLEGTAGFEDEKRHSKRTCTFSRAGLSTHTAECSRSLWIYKNHTPIQQTYTYSIKGSSARVTNVRFEHSEVNDGRLNRNRYALEELERLIAPMTFREESGFINDAFEEARNSAQIGELTLTEGRLSNCDLKAGATRKDEINVDVRLDISCPGYLNMPDWRSDRAIIRATEYWINKTNQSTERPDQNCKDDCIPTRRVTVPSSFSLPTPQYQYAASKWAKACGLRQNRDLLLNTASVLSKRLGVIGENPMTRTALLPQFHYELLDEELRLAQKFLLVGKKSTCDAILRDFGPNGMIRKGLVRP